MASPSGPGQPSGPDPGSVRCDNCKKSILGSSQGTDNATFTERLRKIKTEWCLSPRMWPIGYIIESPYSPFWIEQLLPARDWRNAFEDLLALASGGEMISPESRKKEKAVGANLTWDRASKCIEKLNNLNARDASQYKHVQTTFNAAKSPGLQMDPSLISWMERKMSEAREMVQHRVAVAEAFKNWEATRRELSASRQKARGQWMASLITSGALGGWNSTLKDSEHGDLIVLRKEVVTPEDDQDSIGFTERELREHFEDGKPLEDGVPGPPLYRVSHRPPVAPVDDHQFVDENSAPQTPPDEPVVMSRVPERPCFWGQETTAERITLPNQKTATRVVMKNYLTDGGFEEKVMIQEPGKVLQEVEKAKALIEDRMFGLD